MPTLVVHLGIYTYALRCQGRRTHFESGIFLDKGRSNSDDALQGYHVDSATKIVQVGAGFTWDQVYATPVGPNHRLVLNDYQ